MKWDDGLDRRVQGRVELEARMCARRRKKIATMYPRTEDRTETFIDSSVNIANRTNLGNQKFKDTLSLSNHDRTSTCLVPNFPSAPARPRGRWARLLGIIY